jgi:hypothetical protein
MVGAGTLGGGPALSNGRRPCGRAGRARLRGRCEAGGGWLGAAAVWRAPQLEPRPRSSQLTGRPLPPPHAALPSRRPQRLRVLAKAADCISAGDTVNRRIRGAGQWGLLPFAALVGSVMPAIYMRGRRESFSEAGERDVSARGAFAPLVSFLAGAWAVRCAGRPRRGNRTLREVLQAQASARASPPFPAPGAPTRSGCASARGSARTAPPTSSAACWPTSAPTSRPAGTCTRGAGTCGWCTAPCCGSC